MNNTGKPKSGKGVRGACRGCRRAIGDCAPWCSANRVGRQQLPLDSDIKGMRMRAREGQPTAAQVLMRNMVEDLVDGAMAKLREARSTRAPEPPPAAQLEPCPFAPGQQVRCVDDGPDTLLKAGEVYIVERIAEGAKAIGLRELGGLWRWHRFEAAQYERCDAVPDPVYVPDAPTPERAQNAALASLDATMARYGGVFERFDKAVHKAIQRLRLPTPEPSLGRARDAFGNYRDVEQPALPPGWREDDSDVCKRRWVHESGALVGEFDDEGGHRFVPVKADYCTDIGHAPTMLQAMALALGLGLDAHDIVEYRLPRAWLDERPPQPPQLSPRTLDEFRTRILAIHPDLRIDSRETGIELWLTSMPGPRAWLRYDDVLDRGFAAVEELAGKFVHMLDVTRANANDDRLSGRGFG